MEEKVDILLTTYNTKIEYLKLQIDSILNQTYRNFNLIISDDCSSDDKVKQILNEYAEKDNRIKLNFQKDNLGCTKNFEFLLNQAKSEYIMFSDHDDIWHLDKIEKSLKILKEKDVDLVYCDARHIDSDGKIISNSYLEGKKLAKISGKYNIQTVSRHFAIGCSQMFTKTVKEKMIPFTENTKVHDWHSVYIANCLKGIYCIKEPLLDYRLHESNIVGGRNLNQNLKIWKKENGKRFKSFIKYRHKVISETYLSGTKMCIDYNSRLEKDKIQKDKVLLEKEIEEENKIIKYYEKCQNSKFVYFSFHKYFKYLYFKGIGTRLFKELVMLHFPIFSFIVFCIG